MLIQRVIALTSLQPHSIEAYAFFQEWIGDAVQHWQ